MARKAAAQAMVKGPKNPVSFVPPDPVAVKFMRSDAFVRGIRGPFGSGKSVLCVHEVMRRAQQQEPFEENGERVRRSRWAIVRNTFPELKLTTVKTWLEWVPETLGPFLRSAPFTHHLTYKMPDGSYVDCEVIFLALDRPSDVAKLLSLDLTGAWINEARELPKEILDGVTARVNRYPSPAQGGPTWSGVIMDTNSPPKDHWWPIMAGEVPAPEWMTEDETKLLVKPGSWEFYTQPAAMIEILGEDGRVLSYAMNPDRANQKLPDKYYLDLLPGKSRTWINIYVLNRYDEIVSGRPVYPEFSRDVHVASQRLAPLPSHSVILGADFGRTPAVAFLQEIDGRFVVFHELVLAGVSTQTLAIRLSREITKMGWTDFTYSMWGDPAGDDMAQTRDETPLQIMRASGFKQFTAAPTNDPLIRIEAVAAALTKMTVHGPGFLISPHCKGLIAGFEGGYQFRQVGGSHGQSYETKPYKNRHSHIHDALQYGVVGAGGWKPMLKMARENRSVTAPRIGNPFQRQSTRMGARRWQNT